MKTLITIALCLALLELPMAAQAGGTNSVPVPTAPTKDSAALAALVVVCVIVAGYIVVKLMRKIPGPNATVVLVLEKSMDHATWTYVTEKTCTLTNGELSASIYFEQEMTDPVAFYRARIKR